MVECLYCGHKGIFLSISENGLCDSCEPVVMLSVTSRVRILNDSRRLVETSKKMDVRLTRLDLLLQTARELLEYENLGIPTIRPLPSEYLAHYSNIHDAIVVECMEAEFDKMTSAKARNTRIRKANEVLLKIGETKKILKNRTVLDALEAHLKVIMQEL